MRRILTLLALGFSSLAYADCACVCMNGSVQAICQSSWELRPICAPQVCPIVPPSIAPIQVPMVPPVGTSNCRPVQVWTGSGYAWRTVCN